MFRVTPAEPRKVVRIVEFFLNGRDGEEDAQIDCYAEGTLVGCEANSRKVFCSHVNRSIQELLKQEEEPAMSNEAFVPELEPKHTPTPWRVGKLVPGGTMSTVISDSAKGLEKITGACDVEYYGGNMIAESVTPENAEFIVQCCNAYDLHTEIVERFIKDCVSEHEGHGRPFFNCRNHDCVEAYQWLKRLGREEEFSEIH